MATICGIPHPKKKVLPSSSRRAPWAIMNSVSVNSTVPDIVLLHLAASGCCKRPKRMAHAAGGSGGAAAGGGRSEVKRSRAGPPHGEPRTESPSEAAQPKRGPAHAARWNGVVREDSSVPLDDRGSSAGLLHPGGADAIVEELLVVGHAVDVLVEVVLHLLVVPDRVQPVHVLEVDLVPGRHGPRVGAERGVDHRVDEEVRDRRPHRVLA